MLSWIEIDGARLQKNIEAFRALIKPTTSLMIVVKANAYGHGLQATAPLAAEKADWLGVNCMDEALELTKLGIRKPIAILGHTEIERMREVVQNEYRQVLYRIDAAKALSDAAQQMNTTAYVHLKIETGTNRQGIPAGDLESFVRQLSSMPRLQVEGV